MQCCTISGFARSYSNSFGCLFSPVFGNYSLSIKQGTYLPHIWHISPGNVLKKFFNVKLLWHPLYLLNMGWIASLKTHKIIDIL